MKNCYVIIIVLCFSGFFTNVFAQDFSSWQINIDDGLAHNTVECIFKDKDGFMWFGTQNGLNRYDGHALKTFQHNVSDEKSISGNSVVSVNQDEDGVMWVGTSRNGLNRFDSETETFKRYISGRGMSNLPSNQILNIKVLEGNELWICTSNGLSLYNAQTDNFDNFFPDDMSITEMPFTVYDVIKSKTGVIYVATNHDFIYQLNKETGEFQIVPYSRDPNLAGNYRKHLVEDNEGNIWISAFAHGLIRLNPQTGESKLFTPDNSDLNSRLINGNFRLTKDNKLWLTSDGDGLIIYDLNTNKFYSIDDDKTQPFHLYDNSVYSLYVDEQGLIWVGTFNAGVNVLDPHQKKFTVLKDKFEQEIDFEDVSVLDVFEDSKGRLWIGTDGKGLYQYTADNELIHYENEPNNSNSLSSNRIVCINEDEDGNLLLGSYMGALVEFNVEKNRYTRYLPDNTRNSISSDHVWDIFIDSENRLWLGLLSEGLDLFDRESNKFINYGPQADNYNRVNHNNIMGIIEDSDGDLWFGTEGKGVNILDKDTRRMHHSIDSDDIKLSNRIVRCLYEDKSGVVWIGTGGGGLCMYDKRADKMECFTMNDGLPNNIISSILEDDSGNLWVGTAYGLSKFNVKTKTFRNYDVSDGLLGSVCNRNAIVRRMDGSMLVGTTSGLNIFHPDSISDITYVPETFFTDFRIQNKLVHIGDSVNGRVVLDKEINSLEQITIVPKDKIFTLEFAARTYILPEKCEFKYKLDGFEKEWKTTNATRKHVTYSNLSAGTYLFRVKASNSDGVWSDDETVLKIIVLPAFWRTVWFKLILVLFGALLFYLWFQYKIGLKEKEFEIEKQEQKQKIIHLEKESLETELNNQTFNVLDRNRSLLKHKRRLSLLLNKVDEKTTKTLSEIINEIELEINEEKDWKHLEPRLDKVYNNFMTVLKSRHENLTQNELRIAAYVRMGLSTKEISEIMQKTIKAIDNERYRLRKKLEIPQNDSLKNYLLNL